jgi:hypothetical protein
LEVEHPVRPPAAVLADVDAEDLLELAAADDQQPVEALTAEASNPALDVRVRVRRPEGRPDDPDASAIKDPFERCRELAVAVVDQEPHLEAAIVEFHQQVVRLLQHPSGTWVGRAREVLDAAVANREEDEDVQAPPPGCRR